MKYCSFSRFQSLTIALVALFLLSLYGWRHHSSQSAKSSQPVVKYVFIQVTGDVSAPGIYSFTDSVTVSQAVARAGGLHPPLKSETVPEWARLEIDNARRIHITVAPEGTADVRMGRMAVPGRLALGMPVDLNQASTADLALVPGISQVLAERIVMTRQRAGGFSRMNDLLAVKGIGPATVRRLRPFLTVGTASMNRRISNPPQAEITK